MSSLTTDGIYEIAISLSTISSNGLVYLVINEEGAYITLGLVDGQILVQYGPPNTYHYINTTITDGEWHILVLTQNGSDVYLTVDDAHHLLATDESEYLTGAIDVYIGMLVKSLPIQIELVQPYGFEGGVIEFQVNNMEIDLVNMETNIGRNVGQNPMLFCSYVTCANEGACNDADMYPWFECDCPFGYTGDFCEISLPFCSPNPCNGGQCEEYEDRTFMCTCPMGYKGRLCEQGRSINLFS